MSTAATQHDVAQQTSTDRTAVRPFQMELSRGGSQRAAQANTRDAVARAGDGCGRFAGRPARDDSGARALLGDGLRLVQVPGAAERPPAVRHRDRRAGHSLHSRSLKARGCVAADHHARVARLDHRAAEDHRPADRPDGTRRKRIGRLRCGDPLAAGLRVLGQADFHRVGSAAHRRRVGGADEAPWIHAVRRAGRRLGRGRHPGDGRTGSPGAARHSLQHARYRPARARERVPARRPAAVRSVSRGGTRVSSS